MGEKQEIYTKVTMPITTFIRLILETLIAGFVCAALGKIVWNVTLFLLELR